MALTSEQLDALAAAGRDPTQREQYIASRPMKETPYAVKNWLEYGNGQGVAGDTKATTPLYVGHNYTLVDNKTGEVLAQGSTAEEIQKIQELAQQLHTTQGKKANWRLYDATPTLGLDNYMTPGFYSNASAPGDPRGVVVAGDMPNNFLKDELVPMLTPLAIAAGAYFGGPLLLGQNAATGGAGALGAAGSDAAISSSVANAINAAYAGAQAGTAAALAPAYGTALSGTGGLLSTGGGLSSLTNTVPTAATTGGTTGTIWGPELTLTALNGMTPAEIAALTAGATGATTVATTGGTGAGTSASTSATDAGYTPPGEEIVVTHNPTNILPTDFLTPGATAAATAANTAGSTSSFANEAATKTGMTPEEIAALNAGAGGNGILSKLGALSTVDKIRLASVLAGTIGGLTGGGSGTGGGGGTVPAGLGQLRSPLFNQQLTPLTPEQNEAKYGARDMTGTDWNTWGSRPATSFFNYVQQPTGMAHGGSFAAKGGGMKPRTQFAVSGPGDGRSDDIPAVLSDGEYVMDAETVALLGNGSPKAGAKKLDDLRVNIRKHKGKKLAQGRFSANAKSPEAYLSGGRA
jgi:hypothetical protein